jgi:hypothetical protein
MLQWIIGGAVALGLFKFVFQPMVLASAPPKLDSVIRGYKVGDTVVVPAIAIRRESSETALGPPPVVALSPQDQSIVGAILASASANPANAQPRIPFQLTAVDVVDPKDGFTRGIGILKVAGTTVRIPFSFPSSNISTS